MPDSAPQPDDISTRFQPDYTPEQLENLGVYDALYRGQGPRLASLGEWKPEWISEHDPKGWAQWYKRYVSGRRIPDEDERQIKRWLSFKARHGGPFAKNPTPRRGWALRNWGIDPAKLVAAEEQARVGEMLDEYQRKAMQKYVKEKMAAKTYYHGSPTPNIEKLRSGSYVTPDKRIAEIFGRFHEDTGKTWSDDDVVEPGYDFGTEIRFKPGREPTGKPTLYSVTTDPANLDLLDNPYEHKTKLELAIQKAAAAQPTAVIIRGNPRFIKNNPAADKFYANLQKYMEQQGYAVSQDAGEPKTVPLPATVWLGHSRGVDRFRFAPEGTKTIGLGAPAGINHPDDNAMTPGDVPTAAHYTLTPEMLAELSTRLKKAELLPEVNLQPHQARIQQTVTEDSPRMIVYHGLGSGKSLSALAAAEAAKKKYDEDYGIVAPASLRGNFQKEVEKFTRGSNPEILSYTGLGLGKKFTRVPETVIMDEAHRLRNPGGAAAQAAADVANQAKRVLLLTGSPITNSPSDLANLISIVARKNISPQEFEKRYIGYKTVHPGLINWLRGIKPGVRPVVKNEGELRELLQGRVDYQPSKTPEGVNVNEEKIEVPLTQAQQKIQKALRTKIPPGFLWKLDQEFPLSKDELAKLNSFLTGLRQNSVSTRPFRVDNDAFRAFQQSGKLQEAYKKLNALLESDPRKKAIIYSNHIGAGVEPYAAALAKYNIPHGIFHGGIPTKQRQKALADYNAGKLRALLIGPAGAEGLSTKGTNLIQLLDPHWHESRTQQARGRGLRFDSHDDLPEELKNVHVQRFISKSEEPSFLGKMLGYRRERTGDEILERLSNEKERINERFRELLRELGSQNHAKTAAFEFGEKQATEPTWAQFGYEFANNFNPWNGRPHQGLGTYGDTLSRWYNPWTTQQVTDPVELRLMRGGQASLALAGAAGLGAAGIAAPAATLATTKGLAGSAAMGAALNLGSRGVTAAMGEGAPSTAPATGSSPSGTQSTATGGSWVTPALLGAAAIGTPLAAYYAYQQAHKNKKREEEKQAWIGPAISFGSKALPALRAIGSGAGWGLGYNAVDGAVDGAFAKPGPTADDVAKALLTQVSQEQPAPSPQAQDDGGWLAPAMLGAAAIGVPAAAYYGYRRWADSKKKQPQPVPQASKTAAIGLWDRIRAKKERGEKPAKPGDKDYPDSKSWKKVTSISEKKAGTPAWQRSEGKNEAGGLNEKGRKSYEREHGGNLKAPVTESNPSGERAKRQNSFCSRMCGMKRVNTGAKTKSDPDSRINKSLRKWNCKCSAAQLVAISKEASLRWYKRFPVNDNLALNMSLGGPSVTIKKIIPGTSLTLGKRAPRLYVGTPIPGLAYQQYLSPKKHKIKAEKEFKDDPNDNRTTFEKIKDFLFGSDYNVDND